MTKTQILANSIYGISGVTEEERKRITECVIQNMTVNKNKKVYKKPVILKDPINNILPCKITE